MEFEWREEVEKLIDFACSEKVLRGGLHEARNFLAEARNILSCEEKVWRAKIDYRDAHLCMRMAGMKNVEGAINEARILYEEAFNKFSSIGYGLPYNKLASLYKIPAAIHARYNLSKEEIKSSVLENEFGENSKQLDSNVYNLIELSAYYAGIWSTDLEGISFEKEEKSYFVLSNCHENFSRIRMTKEFAEKESLNLLNNDMADIVVIFDNDIIYYNKKEYRVFASNVIDITPGVLLNLLTRISDNADQWEEEHIVREKNIEYEVWKSLNKSARTKRESVNFENAHGFSDIAEGKTRWLFACPTKFKFKLRRNFSSQTTPRF